MNTHALQAVDETTAADVDTWLRLALGIDISKCDLHVALTAPAGRVAGSTFANTAAGCTALVKWLTDKGSHYARQQQRACIMHCCMEATGRYGDLVSSTLYQLGKELADARASSVPGEYPLAVCVSIENARQIKHFGYVQARRNKTDKADAQLIAQYCLTIAPQPTPEESDVQRQLKELTRYTTGLKEMLLQEQNRLGSGIRSPHVQQALQEHIEYIKQRIVNVQKEIDVLSKVHQEQADAIALLTSIPGIGILTSVRLVAEIGDAHRFPKVGDLVAFAGLNPAHFQSGSSVNRTAHISKIGNNHLRHALYMPALVAMKHNPTIATFAERLVANGKSGKVLVIAVMRKLLHIVYGVLKSGKRYDENHLLSASTT